MKKLQIQQSLLQRIFKVGSISIPSAGTGDVEIVATVFKDPERLKKIIKENI